MADTHTTYQLSERRELIGRHTEVTLRGKRGRFVFQYARRTPAGIELTFYGGTHGQGQFTTVRPESVKAVKKHAQRRTVVRPV